MHVMHRYDCWSLQILWNEDGSNVFDNVTQLTVSQYFNENLRSPLYSDLPTFFGYGPKTFRAAQGREKCFGPFVGGSGGMLPQKSLKISVLRSAENAFQHFRHTNL